jgi:hypothetical protein
LSERYIMEWEDGTTTYSEDASYTHNNNAKYGPFICDHHLVAGESNGMQWMWAGDAGKGSLAGYLWQNSSDPLEKQTLTATLTKGVWWWYGRRKETTFLKTTSTSCTPTTEAALVSNNVPVPHVLCCTDDPAPVVPTTKDWGKYKMCAWVQLSEDFDGATDALLPSRW